jgi:telomere length regulation protein
MSVVVDSDSSELFATFLCKMKAFEQRKYQNAIITFLTKEHFSSKVDMKEDVPIRPSTAVSAAAALVYSLLRDSEVLKESLVSALIKSSIPALDDSLLARRSVIAAIARDEG